MNPTTITTSNPAAPWRPTLYLAWQDMIARPEDERVFRAVAFGLGKRDIYVWDGNYYALSVTESLGVEESGGMVRVGPVHYNTVEEIERFGEVLGEIATS